MEVINVLFEDEESEEQEDSETMRLLRYLTEHSGKLFTQQQLMRAIGTNPHDMIHLLQELEEKGYLRKENDGKTDWYTLVEHFQQPPTYEPAPEDLRYIG
ncbi:MAG: helix-turn-helix domain-containing protein [Nanoarchaeota archaeon]|nr:helix-turn-helix domain-containing protein [Nanoarchaeota archaeon]